MISRRLVHLCLTALIALVMVQPVWASWQPVLDQQPPGSQVALVVSPLDGGKLHIRHNSDLLLPPASTQKLLTALAAELRLGDAFRFTTVLAGAGEQRGSHWKGDLKLTFSGAPDLTREQLGTLLDGLKRRGIRRINGNLLLDGSAFSGYERAPGWPWDNLGVCYSAPASAMTIEHNCVAASLSLKTGRSLPYAAHLFVPAFQPVSVSSDVQVVSTETQDNELCGLLLERGPGNAYRLHGCVTPQRKIWPLNFAVNDPRAYMAALLKQELSARKLVLRGKIIVSTGAGKNWREMAQVASAPLPELLQTMLQHSDNLYADNLAKTLGQVDSGRGSFALGVREIRRVLDQQAGIRLQPATLKDGSGLSRDNLLSADQLAAVLKYLSVHPQLATYRELPVAGESGTLKYRHSLLQPPLRDNIKAKSGTLNGSSNLAGFLTTASGKRYLFVLMVSGLAMGDDPEAARDRLTEFERNLLQAIYRNG